MVYLLIENNSVKYVTQKEEFAEQWMTGRKRIAIKREVKSVPVYDEITHRCDANNKEF